MKINEAIPSVFQRAYPVLQPSTEMVVALSLLRFHEIDALPIGFKSGDERKLAIFGYSSLSRLLETQAKNYGKFLETPCESAALELSTIGVEEQLDNLFHVFENTKFGFAWVESNELGGFASLRDLLELYGSKMIDTNLTPKDVASPVFSLPKDTKIKSVLQEMFKRRIRRVFISGGSGLVSDRSIINYIFSASRLSAVAKKPSTLLDAKLGDLDLISPVQVSNTVSIREAAASMRKSADSCLVCSYGVITPWDLLMKPFIQKKLTIKS